MRTPSCVEASSTHFLSVVFCHSDENLAAPVSNRVENLTTHISSRGVGACQHSEESLDYLENLLAPFN